MSFSHFVVIQNLVVTRIDARLEELSHSCLLSGSSPSRLCGFALLAVCVHAMHWSSANWLPQTELESLPSQSICLSWLFIKEANRLTLFSFLLTSNINKAKLGVWTQSPFLFLRNWENFHFSLSWVKNYAGSVKTKQVGLSCTPMSDLTGYKLCTVRRNRHF